MTKLFESNPNVQRKKATFMHMIQQVNSPICDEHINEWWTIVDTIQVAFETEECVEKVFQFIGWKQVDDGPQTGVVPQPDRTSYH
jgi:hypothetical protein